VGRPRSAHMRSVRNVQPHCSGTRLASARAMTPSWVGEPPSQGQTGRSSNGAGGTEVPEPVSPGSRSRAEQCDRGAGARVRQTYRTLTPSRPNPCDTKEAEGGRDGRRAGRRAKAGRPAGSRAGAPPRGDQPGAAGGAPRCGGPVTWCSAWSRTTSRRSSGCSWSTRAPRRLDVVPVAGSQLRSPSGRIGPITFGSVKGDLRSRPSAPK
jgi:hypothetical protein